MALLEGDVGGLAGVVARGDDCLAVVDEEDVDVFADGCATAASGGGRFFAFGEDVDAVAALEHGRQGIGCSPPWGVLAEVDVLGYLAMLATWSVRIHGATSSGRCSLDVQ